MVAERENRKKLKDKKNHHICRIEATPDLLDNVNILFDHIADYVFISQEYNDNGKKRKMVKDLKKLFQKHIFNITRKNLSPLVQSSNEATEWILADLNQNLNDFKDEHIIDNNNEYSYENL